MSAPTPEDAATVALVDVHDPREVGRRLAEVYERLRNEPFVSHQIKSWFGDAAHALLSTALPLCSQCGEKPACMVKIGTTDAWCTDCLDLASEPADDLRARLTALLEKELADDAAADARSEVADVRCLSCNLRYEERQEYGCHESGRGHSYDDAELEEAAERGRQEREYVTFAVADVRALLVPTDPTPAACRCKIVGWTSDPAEPHIPEQPEWEQADDCPVHPLTDVKPWTVGNDPWANDQDTDHG